MRVCIYTGGRRWREHFGIVRHLVDNAAKMAGCPWGGPAGVLLFPPSAVAAMRARGLHWMLALREPYLRQVWHTDHIICTTYICMSIQVCI